MKVDIDSDSRGEWGSLGIFILTIAAILYSVYSGVKDTISMYGLQMVAPPVIVERSMPKSSLYDGVLESFNKSRQAGEGD